MAALAARRPPAPASSTSKHIPTVENHFIHYPFRLNFYDSPPQFDVTLEQFESFALDRLRLLTSIESSYIRNKSFEELKATVRDLSRKHMPLNSNTAKGVDLDEERKKDHVSHFVLRLAFCRTEELRRRFCKSEVSLFRVRWETDDIWERDEWIKSRDFGWEEVSDSERAEIEEALRVVHAAAWRDSPPKYYKVHWTRVPDLVEKRRVYLRAGTAYVPSMELSSVVFQQFQTDLGRALEMTARVLPRMDEDRLTPILDHLAKGFLAGITSEYSNAPETGEAVTAGMIDDLAIRHWPLCMRSLHTSLRKDSHLKHEGRLQYGLFLKVVGLSVEEAIVFWRTAFSKHMSDDKWAKEHLYNIKHNYGLVGKRTNYPARSCQTILTKPPATDQNHGCPFRHFAPQNLSLALQSYMGISGSDMKDIMTSVEGQHYHIACTRVFELTHGLRKGEGLGGGECVSHPNEYAKRSRELEKEKKGEEMNVD